MATHETGHGIDDEHDGNDKLETHEESHENHDTGTTSRPSLADERPDEERDTESDGPDKGGKGGKKVAPTLQDQTNLLPVKQVILVFIGLTCALFCSLIDQTM
jgi:hypothetical protein